MTTIRTLYEILELSPRASELDVHAAYAKSIKRLDSNAAGQTTEQIAVERESIERAYATLSNAKARAAYDQCLAMTGTGAPPDNAALINVAMHTNVSVNDAVLSPVKTPLTVIALVMAIGMVIQIGCALVAYARAQLATSSSELQKNEAMRKAEEKLALQDYYQKTGIRAKDKIEMELLEADRRRSEDTERKNAYEAREQERKYHDFVEAGRRRGEEVSRNLTMAEERLRREEDEARRQEYLEAERARRASGYSRNRSYYRY